MAFQGNIETFFLSSLFQLLTMERKTGILHLEKEKDDVDIYMKEGAIVNAISSRSKNRLGYLLRTKGIITSEDLEKCLSISRENGQKLGKVLVENNHITTEDLEKFLNNQVEEIILDLFIWKKGNFEFREFELNTDKQVLTNIDTQGIILKASRRVDEISLLKNTIPDENMVLITNSAISSIDKLNEEERPILELINGKRTIREVVIESGYDQHSANKIIKRLISSGFTELSKEKQALETGQQTDNSASTELQLDLELVPQDEPQPSKEPDEEKPAETIVVDTDVEEEITQNEGVFSSYKNKHEKGESTHVDPRETESKRTGKDRFVPDITLVKATSQTSDTSSLSIDFSNKKKLIGLAAIAIGIAVIITVFIFRPDNKTTAPSTQPQKIEEKEKIPETEKTKPAIKKKGEEKEKETFILKHRKYSNTILSISLPDGYKVTDKSTANIQKIFFEYGKDIKIQLTFWKQKEEWNPETMMYKKIEEIQKRKDGSHSLRVNNYNLININSCKGYEMVMSGRRDYTSSRIYLCALSCKGKMFVIDVDCKNSKDPGILKIFNTIKGSMAKSLIVN